MADFPNLFEVAQKHKRKGNLKGGNLAHQRQPTDDMSFRMAVVIYA